MLRAVNLSIGAVLATYGLIYGSRLLVAKGQLDRPEGMDNAHPRAQQAKLEGGAARALGAHQNAFEAFAPFAVAVVFASLGPAYAQRHDLIDGLAWAHFASRVVYTGLYVGDIPSARTGLWLVGQGITTALFIIALLAG